MPSRRVVFRRAEAGDTLLECRELDDDEAVKRIWTLEYLETAAPREDPSTVLCDDAGHEVGVLLVGDRIFDARASYQ